MTSRKQRRTTLILSALVLLSLSAGLILWALNNKIEFFVTPAKIIERGLKPNQRFRLGGLVEKSSFIKQADGTVGFKITDAVESIQVHYKGILPDLFREGQGVVAEGRLNEDNIFLADTILAKHDENYMPKELADELREMGVLRER